MTAELLQRKTPKYTPLPWLRIGERVQRAMTDPSFPRLPMVSRGFSHALPPAHAFPANRPGQPSRILSFHRTHAM